MDEITPILTAYLNARSDVVEATMDAEEAKSRARLAKELAASAERALSQLLAGKPIVVIESNGTHWVFTGGMGEPLRNRIATVIHHDLVDDGEPEIAPPPRAPTCRPITPEERRQLARCQEPFDQYQDEYGQ